MASFALRLEESREERCENRGSAFLSSFLRRQMPRDKVAASPRGRIGALLGAQMRSLLGRSAAAAPEEGMKIIQERASKRLEKHRHSYSK